MTELNRQILEEIASSSAEGIIVIDAGSADLPVVYVNPAYESLTGYTAEEALGRAWPMLEAGDEDSPEVASLKAALGRSEQHDAALADVRKDGTSWLSFVRVRPIVNRRGELKQFLIMQSEAPVSSETQRGLQVGLLQRELRRARQKAANLDRVDFASGLLRFDYFLEAATRDYRIAKREKQHVAIALFDINDLAIYQQTFGAKAADSCLRMIAAQVTGALRRAGDLCGTDEHKRIFALTLGQEVAELERAVERIATNVRRLGLHNPRARSGRYVTVSTAVAAHVPSGASTLASLMDEAAGALDERNAAADDKRRSAGA